MTLIVLLSLACLLGTGLVVWAKATDEPEPAPPADYRPRHVHPFA